MADDEPVRAYHLMTANHAITSIGLRRLKVARFSEVNDPFELYALNCFAPNGSQRLAALKGFKASKNETIGLLCFSKTWRSPVLWSHYADGHKGICLGFDLYAKDVRAVRYDTSKLELPDEEQDIRIPPELEDQLLVTKFSHWSYEQEVRKIVPLKLTTTEAGMHFFPFGDDLRLREVILGHLCPASLLKPTRALVKDLGLDAAVSKARLGYKFFEVKEDGRYPAV